MLCVLRRGEYFLKIFGLSQAFNSYFSILYFFDIFIVLSSYIYMYILGAYNNFPDFFVWAFKIVVDS